MSSVTGVGFAAEGEAFDDSELEEASLLLLESEEDSELITWSFC